MVRFIQALAVATLIAIALLGLPALAQSDRNAATGKDAIAPVEEFSREVENLKKTFTDLNKRIENSAKSIDQLESGDASRKELDQLREIVGKLLGAVADNGTVSKLGDKALSHAREKLRKLRAETRFTVEQREFLLQEWTRLVTEIERASAELEGARTRFTGLLRTLQTNDDYIAELIEIRQSKEALKVIKELAKEIHNASNMLNNFINAISPPRPGT